MGNSGRDGKNVNGGFRFNGGLMVHLGRHGQARAAMLAAALAVTVVSAALPALGGSLAGIDPGWSPAVAEVVGAFRHDANSFVAAANAAAAKAGNAGTCFGAQLDGKFASTEIQRRVEASTVYVVGRDRDGQVVDGGTGTVVRGSGGKILTAAHVSAVGGLHGVVEFRAYSSTGQLLGDLSEVAHGRDTDDGLDIRDYQGHVDLGVLAVTSGTAASKAALDAIPGLDLASVQGLNATTGIFGSATMVGTNHGHSGAALLGAGGEIQGVLATGRPLIRGYGGTVDVRQPNIEGLATGGTTVGEITTSRATGAGFIGVGDPRILAALGEAGQHVQAQEAFPNELIYPGAKAGAPPVLYVAGFSLQGCRASEGYLDTAVRDTDRGLDMVPPGEFRPRVDAMERIRGINRAIIEAAGLGTVPPQVKADPAPVSVAADIARPPSPRGELRDVASVAVGVDGSIVERNTRGEVVAMVPARMPSAGAGRVGLASPGAWIACGAPGMWRADTAAGAYVASIGPERIALSFAPESLAEVTVASLPRNGAEDSQAADRIRTVAQRHADVISLASQAVPAAQASFTVTPWKGGVMEVCRLDGQVGFPPDLGPAVRIKGADGTLVDQAFVYGGRRLGKEQSGAIVAFQQEFPDGAAIPGVSRSA